jgi:hypothetical protein
LRRRDADCRFCDGLLISRHVTIVTIKCPARSQATRGIWSRTPAGPSRSFRVSWVRLHRSRSVSCRASRGGPSSARAATPRQLNRAGRVAVWSSKYGKAKSFRIGGQLCVQFPVRPKAEQPTPGSGA